MFKKLSLMILVLFLLISLVACGQPLKSGQSMYSSDQDAIDSDDFVFFTNADGSDCDLDDILEGDSDCFGVDRNGYTKKVTKNYATTHKAAITSNNYSKVPATAKPTIKPSTTSKPSTTTTTSKPITTSSPSVTTKPPTTSSRTGSFSTKSSTSSSSSSTTSKSGTSSK